MVRNGKTAAGSQRWLCKSCRATTTHKLDNTAKQLKTFLKWLLSNERQADMAGGGRTFRRKCSKFWSIWPLAPITGEVHHVVFVDGIYLARNVVVLIACTQEHVIGWYLARSENSRSWAALMGKIPPPDVVVCDGGTGFEKARKRVWPTTRVQRCTFHAFCQVRAQTTSRPKLQAGVELYGLAKELLAIKEVASALAWLEAYSAWCSRWEGFLAERTLDEESGRMRWTHERLVTARNRLEQAREQEPAVHLPGSRAYLRRANPEHEQQDRGRNQRTAQTHAERPSRAEFDEKGEGYLLVVLCSYGSPASGS